MGEENTAVNLCPGGLRLASGEVLPLHAGAVHYWRLERRHWRAALKTVRETGFKLVDFYTPWGVHERAPGQLDLGEEDERLDVRAFLDLLAEEGLYAIVRPGPHINAELTYFGLPKRIVWDPACQARSPEGNPVVLPMIPTMFPVPSYASEAYLDEATRFYHLLGEALAPYVYPEGPIVLLQVDNEGAMFFRDGPYDQDHHPDALAKYHAFLRERFGSIDALRTAYPHLSEAEGPMRFSDVAPPRAFDVETTAELAHHLDWAAFQEDLVAQSLARLNGALQSAGLGGIPTTHNFSLSQDRTPLNAARVNGAGIDLVGFDYYNLASEADRASVARRSSELAVRSEKQNVPAYACELGAGYPPFFPPLAERDTMFTALCCLAYGVRGFNVYMAVERDRWVGAPIDPRGRPRRLARFWKKLIEALDGTDFHHLKRRVPVRLVVPRMERRLARVAHAFGPASGALLAVFEQGPRESCYEDDLGLGYPLAVEADNFLRSFEQALDSRGVPFAVVGGEDRDIAFDGASWVVCTTSGGFADTLAGRLAEVAGRGARLTVGPHRRRFDGSMSPLEDPESAFGGAAVDWVERDDPASADAEVSRAVEALGLPSFACDPDPVRATVHEDADGVARVVFVINPGETDVMARVSLGVEADFEDPIDPLRTRSDRGVLELRVKPYTVRMLLRR